MMPQVTANGMSFLDNAAQTAAQLQTRPFAKNLLFANTLIAAIVANVNANMLVTAHLVLIAKFLALEVALLHAQHAEHQLTAHVIQAVCGVAVDARKCAPALEQTHNAQPTPTASGIVTR